MALSAQGLEELSGLRSRASLRIQLVPVGTGLKCRYNGRITRGQGVRCGTGASKNGEGIKC